MSRVLCRTKADLAAAGGDLAVLFADARRDDIVVIDDGVHRNRALWPPVNVVIGLVCVPLERTRQYPDAVQHFSEALFGATFVWILLKLDSRDVGLRRLFGGKLDDRLDVVTLTRTPGTKELLMQFCVMNGPDNSVLIGRDADRIAWAAAYVTRLIDEALTPRTSMLVHLDRNDDELVQQVTSCFAETDRRVHAPFCIQVATDSGAGRTRRRTTIDTYDAQGVVWIARCKWSRVDTVQSQLRRLLGNHLVHIANAGPNEFFREIPETWPVDLPLPWAGAMLQRFVPTRAHTMTHFELHQDVVNSAIALCGVMAPYELLEVVERLPHMNWLRRKDKIRPIERVAQACRRFAEQRQLAAGALRRRADSERATTTALVTHAQ